MWTFSGHKRTALDSSIAVRLLSQADRSEADAALAVAGKRLGRKTFAGSTDYVKDLLRRNYTIARDSQAVCAVAKRNKKAATALSVNVSGGTGWTCQLFFDLYLAKHNDEHQKSLAIPLYLHDQEWLQCFAVDTGRNKKRALWKSIEPEKMLLANLVVGGVGTRSVSSTGTKAIRQVCGLDC